MVAFAALDELLDDALELPIPGRDGKRRTYRIASPESLDGLKIQQLTTLATRLLAGGEAVDTTLLGDDEEYDLIKMCLGPTDEELQADGVSWTWRRHAGLTCLFWLTNGKDSAEKYWLAAGDPSRMAPNRETRRKAAKKTGSATASKTRSRGSSSGTSARKATASAPKAART